MNRFAHLNYVAEGLPRAPLVNLFVAVRDPDFLVFQLGILMEFIYEMSTARRDLSKNDLFGIYI